MPPSLDVSISAASTELLEDLVANIIVSPTSSRATFRNWGQSFICKPVCVFAPTTVEQCAAIVELARRKGVQLRAVGRAHSPSDLPFTKGWAVRMERLKGILSIDHETPSVTALAGTFISDIHEALDSAKPRLAMCNVGSISEQTIGGLISTASHGTGIQFPVISAFVQKLTILCPLEHGTQHLTCSREHLAELFNATLCGLGSTGLITSITLRVQSAFNLKQFSEEVSFDSLFGVKTGFPAAPANARFGGSIGRLVAQSKKLPPCQEQYMPSFLTQKASDIYPISSQSSITADIFALDDPEDDIETRQAQKRLEQVVSSAQHVRLMWFPQANRITMLRTNRSTQPHTPSPWRLARMKTSLINHRLTELLLYISRFNNRITPTAVRWIHYLTHPSFPTRPLAIQPLADPVEEASFSADGLGQFPPDSADPPPLSPHHPVWDVVGRSDKIFNMDCLFPQYTDEWAIPFSRTAAVLRAMREWLDEEEKNSQGERIHFPVEIRFSDADGIWLSHSHGRKTCYIGIVQYRPYNKPVRYRKLFAKFEALMSHYAGRPHWAKTHTCSPRELARLYPNWNQFLAIRQKYDPDHVFVNPYVARHLLGQVGDHADSRVFKSRL